jgi:hypothetical protein
MIRSAEEIEAAIRHTRDRIGAALDALTGRLTPRRLADRGLAALKRRPRSTEAQGIHVEPLAIGLIAAGLAWLILGNVRRRREPGPEETRCAEREIAEGEIAEGAAAPASMAAHPLLIGLLGLGAGAALAALLPSSRGERQLIARAREELWQGGEALGHETAAWLRNLCEAAPAAAVEEPAVRQTETGKRDG